VEVQAAAAPVVNVTNDVQAPIVNVNNDVQPAEVVMTHPKRSVQKVIRDGNFEIDRTETEFFPE